LTYKKKKGILEIYAETSLRTISIIDLQYTDMLLAVGRWKLTNHSSY